MEQQQHTRHTWTVIVLYLLAVLALTLPMTLSKFESTASGSDTAAIAKFEVGMEYGTRSGGTLQFQTLNLTDLAPGDTKTFDVVLTNNSDVKVEYRISCETAGNLPLTFSYSSSKSDTLGFDTEDKEKTVTVTVTWPSDKNTPELADMVDYLRVIVEFDQIN